MSGHRGAQWEDAIHEMGQALAVGVGGEWERTEAPMGRGKRGRRLKSDGVPDFALRLPDGGVVRIEAKEHCEHNGAWRLSVGLKVEQIKYMLRATAKGERCFVLLRWLPPVTQERPARHVVVWLLPWEGLERRCVAYMMHLARLKAGREAGLKVDSEGPPPFALDELDELGVMRCRPAFAGCPIVPAKYLGVTP